MLGIGNNMSSVIFCNLEQKIIINKTPDGKGSQTQHLSQLGKKYARYLFEDKEDTGEKEKTK